MGMYTRLKMVATLDQDKKEEWKPGIDYLSSHDWSNPTAPEGLNHPIFTSERRFMIVDEDCLDENLLKVEADIKNYRSCLDKFLDWISPFVKELHGGTWYYEEQIAPSPLIIVDGKIKADTDHPNYRIEF